MFETETFCHCIVHIVDIFKIDLMISYHFESENKHHHSAQRRRFSLSRSILYCLDLIWSIQSSQEKYTYE